MIDNVGVYSCLVEGQNQGIRAAFNLSFKLSQNRLPNRMLGLEPTSGNLIGSNCCRHPLSSGIQLQPSLRLHTILHQQYTTSQEECTKWMFHSYWTCQPDENPPRSEPPAQTLYPQVHLDLRPVSNHCEHLGKNCWLTSNTSQDLEKKDK